MSLFKTDTAKYATEQREWFEDRSTSELIQYSKLLRERIDEYDRQVRGEHWSRLEAIKSWLYYVVSSLALIGVLAGAYSALSRLSVFEWVIYGSACAWVANMYASDNQQRQRAIQSEVLWTIIQERREQEKTTKE